MSVIFDVNTYLKNDATIQTHMGATPNIKPLVGYQQEAPPFIVYQWRPGNYNVERYFIRVDIIRYTIFDDEYDRGSAIAERMERLLNIGDNAHTAIASSNYRIMASDLNNGDTGAPLEREGWYSFRLDYKIEYVNV